MTQKKPTQRALSLILICAMLLSFSIPASAKDLHEQDVESPSNVQPRSFVREYYVYLTNTTFKEIMSDSNWWGETTVTVAVVSSTGDSNVSVRVKDSLGNISSTKNCSFNGKAAVFSIPAGSFTVYAKYSAAFYGYVTLSVSLA